MKLSVTHRMRSLRRYCRFRGGKAIDLAEESRRHPIYDTHCLLNVRFRTIFRPDRFLLSEIESNLWLLRLRKRKQKLVDWSGGKLQLLVIARLSFLKRKTNRKEKQLICSVIRYCLRHNLKMKWISWNGISCTYTRFANALRKIKLAIYDAIRIFPSWNQYFKINVWIVHLLNPT